MSSDGRGEQTTVNLDYVDGYHCMAITPILAHYIELETLYSLLHHC